VGHAETVQAIREKGLKVKGVRGDLNIKIAAEERLNYVPDLAILATKTQDLAKALAENRKFLKDSVKLTTQKRHTRGEYRCRICAGREDHLLYRDVRSNLSESRGSGA